MVGLLDAELLTKCEKSYLIQFTCGGVGVSIDHWQAPIISILPCYWDWCYKPVPAGFSHIFVGFRDTDGTDSEKILCVNCGNGWIGP